MLDFTTPAKITLNELPSEQFVHKLEGNKPLSNRSIQIAAAAVVLLGILSGFFLSFRGEGGTFSSSTESQSANTKAVVGSSDTKTFRDSAEGSLETGGINGEGTHKLIRPGGDSQTVYLTSSVLDLSQFVGKKVRVWGETNAAQQAGWLMDVGKVETLE